MEILEILLQICIVIGILFLAFGKGYSSERGKNLATKKDIEEITEKVESVKSDINILTENKLSLHSNERETIMEFYDSYTKWKNTIGKKTPFQINENNYAEYFTFVEEMIKHQQEYELKKGRLRLIISDRKLDLILKEIFSLMLELQSICRKSLIRTSYAYKEYENNKRDTEKDEMKKMRNQLLIKVTDIYDEFGNKSIDIHDKLYPKEQKMKEILRNKLYDRVEE